MSRAWILPVYVGALGGLPAAGALAQTTQYETPLYTTQAPAELDKNYGLPTFGMPGAELPQQKTMATDRAASTPDGSDKAASTADGSDFFAGSTPIELPKTGASASARGSTTGGSAAAGADMETPLFTTSQGSSSGSAGSWPSDSETTSGYTTSSDGSDNAATQ